MKKRNVFIADGVWERLKKLGESSGMKVAELIRRAVIEFLEREENK